MSDTADQTFADLVPNARAFLSELAHNNTRDWFTEHKPRYESGLKRPGEHLLDAVAAEIAGKHGITLKPKLFRPQRDVRFSKDKTPYNTHLHLLWAMDGPSAPSLFFGVALDYVTAGGGVMGFGKDTLSAWRAYVDTDGDKIRSDLDILEKEGFSPREPELKRVPAPYDADHPRADLLRRKSLTLWRDLDDASDPKASLVRTFDALSPLLTRLNTLS